MRLSYSVCTYLTVLLPSVLSRRIRNVFSCGFLLSSSKLFEEVVIWKGQLPRNCCEGDDFGFVEQPEMSFHQCYMESCLY